MTPSPRLLLALAGAALLAPRSQQPALVAIVGADLLTMEQPGITRDQTVLVRGDRIVSVGPSRGATIPAGTRRIDAGGRYLLPGLVDMHVHVDEADLPLFVANGVTTVREMNGSARHLALRDRVTRDPALPMPALYVAGTLLAGVPQRHRHRLVQSPEQGRAAAREQVEDGYDFIKVYDGLSKETYDAIVAEAHRARRPVAGHLPAGVGLDGALAAGQQDITHSNQIMQAVTGADPDTAAIAPAVARIRAAGAWVESTLASLEVLSRQRSPWFDSLFERPEMAYVDAETMGWWNSLRRPASAPAPSQAGDARPVTIGERRLAWMQRLTRELARAGVPLLVGTDTPNPLMVPGFSMHDELEALVRAGLTPYEVLRAATRGAAELVGRPETFGRIAPGARADLVLVDADPLADLSRLRHPAAVMLRGRWLDAASLAALLDAARKQIRP